MWILAGLGVALSGFLDFALFCCVFSWLILMPSQVVGVLSLVSRFAMEKQLILVLCCQIPFVLGSQIRHVYPRSFLCTVSSLHIIIAISSVSPRQPPLLPFRQSSPESFASYLAVPYGVPLFLHCVRPPLGLNTQGVKLQVSESFQPFLSDRHDCQFNPIGLCPQGSSMALRRFLRLLFRLLYCIASLPQEKMPRTSMMLWWIMPFVRLREFLCRLSFWGISTRRFPRSSHGLCFTPVDAGPLTNCTITFMVLPCLLLACRCLHPTMLSWVQGWCHWYVQSRFFRTPLLQPIAPSFSIWIFLTLVSLFTDLSFRGLSLKWTCPRSSWNLPPLQSTFKTLTHCSSGVKLWNKVLTMSFRQVIMILGLPYRNPTVGDASQWTLCVALWIHQSRLPALDPLSLPLRSPQWGLERWWNKFED